MPKFYRMFSESLGYVGGAIILVSIICMIDPSLRQEADEWLFVGVGALVISGALLATPHVVQGVRDFGRSTHRLIVRHRR